MISFEQSTVVIADQDKEWGRVAAAAIAELNPITSMDYIDKGWSNDKKYRITAANGAKYLLRVTPQKNYGSDSGDSSGRQEIQNAKQINMFHIQQKVAALGVPMCRPVACGWCEEGFYSIQTWIDGGDAEEVIPGLTDAEQYACGLEAGRILKMIHSIPAPDTQPDWEMRFNAKMDRKIKMYDECPVKFDGAEHGRFMNLPAEDRLQVFRDVLAFLEYVNDRGYVAIDFYDGSIMYDSCWRQGAALSEKDEITDSCDQKGGVSSLKKGKTTICDIDFFSRKPFHNHMGRMWGSSSFMSPEEFALGAELDEITNVYTAGAFAFALFGGYRRGLDDWTLGEACFEVAKKAVSDDRGSRQQSIRQLIQEWEEALV